MILLDEFAPDAHVIQINIGENGVLPLFKTIESALY